MDTHADHGNPALGILVVTLAAVAFGLVILALQEWTPLVHDLEKAVPAEIAPAESVCRHCGVIESVRSVDRAEAGRAGITVRGLGDDLMSVLGLVAGALVGNRFQPGERPRAVHEVTVRLEDGSTRVLRTDGAREWEPGDRVRVVRGRIFPNS